MPTLKSARFVLKPSRWCFPGAVGLLVLLLAWPVIARSQAGLCEQAARTAARTHGVPLDVLRIVALLETGRKRGGALQPWPWALNAAGTSHWLPDKDAAAAKARAILATGHRNLDFGCFQINYHWHGAQFAGVEDMLDPDLNADYAARFLLTQYQRLGDWKAATGAYHSRTPEHAERYLARHDRIKRNLPPLAEAIASPPAPGPERPRNGFALLTGGDGVRGSLVPASVLARSSPPIAMARRAR